MNKRILTVMKLVGILLLITICATWAIVGYVQPDDPDSLPVAKAPTPEIDDPSRWLLAGAGVLFLGWVAISSFRTRRKEKKYLAEAAMHRLELTLGPEDVRRADDRWREKLVNQ